MDPIVVAAVELVALSVLEVSDYRYQSLTTDSVDQIGVVVAVVQPAALVVEQV